MNFTDQILSPSFDATQNGDQDYDIGVSQPTAIQVIFEGIAGGPPTVTISASNNGIHYASLDTTVFPYSVSGANDNIMFVQQSTPYKKIRISYLANGATAGTYSISIVKD